jgi:superfamily II DNA or RNA helicase
MNLSGLTRKERTVRAAIAILIQNEASGKTDGMSGHELYTSSCQRFSDLNLPEGTFCGYLSVASREPGSEIRLLDRRRGYTLSHKTVHSINAEHDSSIDTKSVIEDLLHFELDWEKQAAIRIETILELADLKLLAKDVYQILRKFKRDRGADVEPKKSEIAAGLLKIYGRELLSNGDIGKEMRACLAKRLGVLPLSRFDAGKRAAREFVKSCGLPPQLAGEASSDDREDILSIRGHSKLQELEDFQRDCKKQILDLLTSEAREIHSAMLTLPTGAGKTRVAVDSIHEWIRTNFVVNKCPERSNCIIWIAQSEELCEQAVEEFQDIWESQAHVADIRLVRLWGKFSSANETQREIVDGIQQEELVTVIFCTYQRLRNELESEFSGIDPGLRILAQQLDLIVIDEAHHAPAESYRHIVRTLKECSASTDPFFILGLTATPFRTGADVESGTNALREIFSDEIIMPRLGMSDGRLGDRYRKLKDTLQKKGVLAIEDVVKLKTGLHIHPNSEVGVSKEGFNQVYDQSVADALADRKVVHKRHAIITERIQAILKENPNATILYFGPSISDAIEMSTWLLCHGVASGFVSGKTRAYQRTDLINRFRDGELRVLCNCEVLTTGFNAPIISHVIMGRPTTSTVLYTQMIGRGLRGKLFGGTETCQIINVIDEIDGAPLLAHEEYLNQWKT